MNLRSRYELIEVDYLHKLNDKELKWLNAFNEEEINANMKHKGPKLNRSKKAQRECYNRNNARNRDILTRGKAAADLKYMEDLSKEERYTKSVEDKLIDLEEKTYGFGDTSDNSKDRDNKSD